MISASPADSHHREGQVEFVYSSMWIGSSVLDASLGLMPPRPDRAELLISLDSMVFDRGFRRLRPSLNAATARDSYAVIGST